MKCMLIILINIVLCYGKFHKNCNKIDINIRKGITIGISCLAITMSPPLHHEAASARVTDSPSIERFQNAYQELIDLDKNWDKIVQDGDSIRRKLGTVYSPPKCSSPLCSFSIFTNKFITSNYDDMDTDKFESISSEFLEALNQADFLAYSSIFSEYGNGGGGADYINQSRTQVKRAAGSIKEAINFLNKD